MRFKIDWANLIVGRKFTVFVLFYFVFEGNFQVQASPGAYIWRSDLKEGLGGGLIFGGAYTWRGLFGGAYTWRGLFSEFYSTFIRLFVNERVGISLVEVYERLGQSVILVCKMTLKSYRRILWRENILFFLFVNSLKTVYL